MDRYATAAHVVGGMGKLLSAGKTYAIDNACKEIVTFADHSVSDGGLYHKLGFVQDREIPPDYRYLVGENRKHKFGYRIARFASDPSLEFRDGLSEKQLADLNGLVRIWDAGKTRWVIKVS